MINPFGRQIDIEYDKEQIDYFVQGQALNKVDLLWVIDNSGSMQKAQQNLAQNISVFVQELVNQDSDELIDFRMAVITTDKRDKGLFAMSKIFARKQV